MSLQQQPSDRTQVLDHLGLVAGMFDELGISDIIDHATQPNPEMRIFPAGHAVKAMVLNGLGVVNHQRDLVPLCFQHKPTHRLMAPGINAQPLNDDPRGRALDTLYGDGVTDLYRLMAVTAAHCLGLTPRFAHLASTSCHVDGRYKSAEEPDAQGIHMTRGDQPGSSPGPQPGQAGLNCGTAGRPPAADAPAQWQYQRRE